MINKAILMGRLTRDPELRHTGSGTPVCSFSIAIDNGYGDNRGTDFINCVAWRQTAEFINRFFKKGSSICVTGSIQVRTWNDQQNNKRYATEVVVDEAFFVDSKGDGVQGAFDEPAFQTSQAPKFEEVASDDDLPF